MRKNCLLTGTIFWCLIFLLSCQKESTDPPKIQILSPQVDQVIDLSYGLKVEIDLWDDQEIKDYHIWLKSTSDFQYFHEKVKVEEQSHTINYNFDFSDVENDELILKLRVRDNENNKIEQELKVLFVD